MKRAVITGANGFIGTRLCHTLRSEGCHITGVDRTSPSEYCDVGLVGDLSVKGAWSKSLDGADTVFHLAGKVHALSEVKQDDAEYFRINTEGTKKLLEAAQRAGVKRFVFFSTIKAMSRDDCCDGHNKRSEPFTESDVCDPDTPYGRSKLEGEKLVLKGGYVPEPVVLRLCMVYGAAAKGNIQKMLRAISQHRFPPLAEIGNRRSMVHVSDVLQASVLASKHPAAVGEVFIVSDGHTYSTRQMYDLMCSALGRAPSQLSVPFWCLRGLGYIGDGIGQVHGKRFVFDSDVLRKMIASAWFSSDKIQERLGFKPSWDLWRAMPEMVAELKRA